MGMGVGVSGGVSIVIGIAIGIGSADNSGTMETSEMAKSTTVTLTLNNLFVINFPKGVYLAIEGVNSRLTVKPATPCI